MCCWVVQALATACVACGPNQPAETKQATARLVEQLVQLVNPENELDHIGTTGPVRPCPCLALPATPCPALSCLALPCPAMPGHAGALPALLWPSLRCFAVHGMLL